MLAPAILATSRNTGDVARTERCVRSFYILNERWRERTVWIVLADTEAIQQ